MRTYSVGLLFSTSGPYSALGRSALDGALMAIDEVNAAGRVQLSARHCDPQGVPEKYESMTRDMVQNGRLRHVVGGITSWSRKDVIPVLEKHGALLWYPCPYEGFECNDHVVYLGASPNQHLVPLIDHVLATGSRRVFLVGSNYVWGWETLRIARERLAAGGADLTGERYLPLGDTDCAHLIEEVAATRPDLIVNSLIGPSNHAFMQALSALGQGAGAPRVVSANQTEADLDALGPAADGMLSIGAWFETLETGANAALSERLAARFGPGYRASCNFATAYVAVQMLALGIQRAGSDDPRAVFAAASQGVQDTVLGPIAIDPLTRHTSLTPRLAEAQGGRFRIVEDAGQPVVPDPYLVKTPPASPGLAGRKPELRIVS